MIFIVNQSATKGVYISFSVDLDWASCSNEHFKDIHIFYYGWSDWIVTSKLRGDWNALGDRDNDTNVYHCFAVSCVLR